MLIAYSIISLSSDRFKKEVLMTLDYRGANCALVRAIDRQPNSHHLYFAVMDTAAAKVLVLQVSMCGDPDSWLQRYDDLARDALMLASQGTYRQNGQSVRVAMNYPDTSGRLVAVAAAGSQVEDLEALAQRVLNNLDLSL